MSIHIECSPEDEEFNYKMRALSHFLGAYAETIESVNKTVRDLLEKKDKTPEEIEECLSALDIMAEESIRLRESAKELRECLQRMKSRTKK
jgi:predicted RecB family endonuclease